MANITKVYLMSVPLEKDYAHTLHFASAAAQQQYFQGRTRANLTFTDFSYQRKDHIIRIPKHVDDLYAAEINYCMYQNSQYSNKWFYAFITDMKYIDDQRTDVYIKTDCMQTWYFDFNVRPSFIEREHCKDDTVGAHTLPEGLETGEYVLNTVHYEPRLTECSYVMLVMDYVNYADDNYTPPAAINMGGIPYAGGAYILPRIDDIRQIAEVYDKGKVEAITALYVCPTAIINNQNTGELKYSGTAAPAKLHNNISKPSKVNGYTPRNKKLLTYPYSYMLMSNNAGSSNVLQYEHFSNETHCEFEIIGAPVVGGSIKCYPINYKGMEAAYEESIMCGKFPALSWSADMFTNWLTQNSVNIGLGVAGGALQVVGGIATAAATGGVGAAIGGAGIMGGISTIANTLAQVHQQSFTPNSARGNTNGGDINTASKTNTFYFYKMSIKEEFAKVIDEYFDMYGYKCGRVKIPNRSHRENWWYTKTINANITGLGIPQDDLQEIKDCYNRGITFWKDPATIRNYAMTNEIT